MRWFGILATGYCNKYFSNTYYDQYFGGYMLNFSAPDLGFDDPNSNANALSEIILVVNITDPKFTGGDAGLAAFFADKGIQLMYSIQVTWAKSLCYATKQFWLKKKQLLDTVPDLELVSQKPHIKGFTSYESTAGVSNTYNLDSNQVSGF